ncbi:hypothetical protein BJP34_04265 [Moorena producens PAL-8-15-08-1]|uniref:Uncharacterized protein n=1 Tax=Moorena producens PAL-8-15-08-1 TaxID=1458985 RepID=A0A1D8TMC5_9CYAN|nr:hypothetical protein [Moorena producens]AOW98769.1 hypothetical protein BJP34_04265 [Moorena producens PAL-8-15-08-1]
MAKLPLTLDINELDILINCYLGIAEITDRIRGKFYNSIEEFINIFFAYDFRVNQTFFNQRIYQQEGREFTLYHYFRSKSFADFLEIMELTRKKTFPDLLPIHDSYIWEFPIHFYLVNFSEEDYIIDLSHHPDILAYDLRQFLPNHNYDIQRDYDSIKKNHDRAYLKWLIEKNLEKVNFDFSMEGAEYAKEHLRKYLLPYSDFYQTCIDRIGAMGFRFRLTGISEVHTRNPVKTNKGKWIDEIPTSPNCFNVAILMQRDFSGREPAGYANFPQIRYRRKFYPRKLGFLSLIVDSLGYDRANYLNQKYDCEAGSNLSHELGHCFQLYHLGKDGKDFNRPCLGIAPDTIWNPINIKKASIWPWDKKFAENLHAKNMFMNVMSIDTEINESLFFTKAQAARARTVAMMYYRHWMQRLESWEQAKDYLAIKSPNNSYLLTKDFGADPEDRLILRRVTESDQI